MGRGKGSFLRISVSLVMSSRNPTRILDLTQLRHFTPSYPLLESTIITWPNMYAIFWRCTSQLNTVLQTLLLLYRTFNLHLQCMFGKFIFSFDVESLFTNLLLEECIDLAVNYISEGNPDLKLSKP